MWRAAGTRSAKWKKEPDCFRLDPKSFEACKSISIDYAVMEHTNKAAIVPVEMGWSDIGTWAALWDTSDKDTDGNVTMGDVLLLDTHNSYLRSEGPLIAALGVKDLIIVAGADAVLVAPKSAAQDVKKIVDRLETGGRDLHVAPRKTHHAWGTSERVSQGENFQVNRITLNPGAALSSSGHREWMGHWIVVSGMARVTRDVKAFQLKENENCILTDEDHRLENAGSASLCVIEVQVTK